MGAVTVANVKRLGPATWNASRQLVRATVTWSSSYATGGDTLATVMLSTLGLRQVNKVYVGCDTVSMSQGGDGTAPINMTGGSYEVRADVSTPTAPKLLLRKGGTTPVEESNATNVSTVSATLIFEGQA